MCTTVFQLFQNLEGSWSFDRTISEYGSVAGSATFTKVTETEFTYREDGKWTRADGKVDDVWQNYIYRCDDSNIVVLYADRRTLQTLKFSHVSFPVTAASEHKCGEDLYSAVYKFVTKDRFSLVYIVVGPNKNYTIETNFFRTVSK